MLVGVAGVLAAPREAQHVVRPIATAGLAAHPLVGEARYRGLLGALELVSDKASKCGFDPALGLADRLFDTGYANGLKLYLFHPKCRVEILKSRLAQL